MDRGNDAGDFGVANAVSGRSLRNLGNGVLALIARVEAAETEVKTLEMTLPGLRQLIVEGRAAGFREGAEAADNVVRDWGDRMDGTPGIANFVQNILDDIGALG